MESTVGYVSTPELVSDKPLKIYHTNSPFEDSTTVMSDGSVLTTSSAPAKRGRGRPKGAKGICSVCGETGHNKRTCKAAVKVVVEQV